MLNFFDFEFEEMQGYFSGQSWQKFRVKQLWHGMYKELKTDTRDISTLPHQLLDQLSQHLTFNTLEPLDRSLSSDHETEKYLFKLADGLAIETVRMSYHKRETICLSTQVGCAMNCAFCATGLMGWKRNLSPGEIVQQVLFFQRLLQLEEKKITNLVFMGMGEPFQNYDAFLKAANILNHEEGLQIGERRMTVSTVGLPDKILQFAREGRQINLAISLHAAVNENRSQIVPINRKYPIEMLMSACREYLNLTNRRITFEYALMRGFNDSISDARELSHLLRGMLCHVNLINLNPVDDSPYQPTTTAAAQQFSTVLSNAGIPVSMRLRRGIDIHAGCGQLANQKLQS